MARWLVGNSLLRQLSTLPTLHSGIWVLLLLYWDTDKALITDKITLVQYSWTPVLPVIMGVVLLVTLRVTRSETECCKSEDKKSE